MLPSLPPVLPPTSLIPSSPRGPGAGRVRHALGNATTLLVRRIGGPFLRALVLIDAWETARRAGSSEARLSSRVKSVIAVARQGLKEAEAAKADGIEALVAGAVVMSPAQANKASGRLPY